MSDRLREIEGIARNAISVCEPSYCRVSPLTWRESYRWGDTLNIIAKLAAEVIKLKERVDGDEETLLKAEKRELERDRDGWKKKADVMASMLSSVPTGSFKEAIREGVVEELAKERDEWKERAEEAKRDFWSARNAALEEAARSIELHMREIYPAGAVMGTPEDFVLATYESCARRIRALKTSTPDAKDYTDP